IDRLPLLVGAEHRLFQGRPVLEYFPPAHAPVDLDEVALPVHFGTQGAARFQLAKHFALEFLHFNEGVAPGPEALEWFVQYQGHARSPRITSAARSGMLYRSAPSAYSRAFCCHSRRVSGSSRMRASQLFRVSCSKGSGTTRPQSASSI